MKLTLKNIGYSIGARELLKKVNLEMRSGTCCILLGPNGAGKSTLMKVASGYARPTCGVVQLDETPLNSMSLMQRARRIAVLTQQNSLDFPFTAEEVVSMGRTPYGISALDAEAGAVIDALGVDAKRVYTHLSGGEKQLVQLARVFAQVWGQGSKACLLLDEPMTALDLNHQRDVVTLLKKFSSEGTSQLIVMHDINMAAEIADIIFLMSDGEVVGAGPPAEVLSSEALEKTFKAPIEVLDHGAQRFYKTILSR